MKANTAKITLYLPVEATTKAVAKTEAADFLRRIAATPSRKDMRNLIGDGKFATFEFIEGPTHLTPSTDPGALW